MRGADAARYSGKTFECKDGSKTGLPLSKVNDDYCDCAPGTSACDNGRFFCPNRGHLGLTLFSSRVNDGICGTYESCASWTLAPAMLTRD